ncbi:unnamed protein product, partial [Closterium sp. NIES-65]
LRGSQLLQQEELRSLIVIVPELSLFVRFASTRRVPSCLFESFPSSDWFAKLPRTS